MAAAAAVVEQGVHGFLQHPPLVVDDDRRCSDVEQSFEPIVAVYHPAVQVVEVGRGEAPAVQLHHGPQIGREHRHGIEDRRRAGR